MKSYTLSLLLLFFSITQSVKAQSVSGEWYGIGSVNWAGEHNSYLSELTLTQRGNSVTGTFNYFFRSVAIKTNVTGVFNSKTRTLELQARPVLNYQAKDQNGADCPMEGSFTLRISKLETTLTGQFNPTYDYRFTCPPINIKFKKEQPQAKTDDPKLRDLADNLEDDNPLEKLLKEQFPEEKPDTTAPMVAALVKRSFEASEVIEVDADSLKISLYDNGDIDNDTISLFYNRQLISHKQMLSKQPLNFTLPLDTTVNEIAMYAENLGTIPPNTAVAIIYAGDKRYELFMTSNFIKNATIRFRRKPPTLISSNQ
ncbi:hypothetical protein [Aridibaculum aurantiacum]|uniref:hypothetical protein n=1 Tax=Aridibaculum aurantiacum TaxID=2810307 RepID=UPI001A9643FF|nr:hypothetical protein [Aridibaculum aurantiacum]